jgi:hypothetical protein
VSQSDTSAFTLIELTLSVLLIAILTAVGIPSFRSLLYRSELQKATVEFTNALRYAQQRAIMQRIPVRVVLDVKENRFWVPIEEEAEARHYSSRSHRSTQRRRSERANRRIQEEKVVQGHLPKGFIFEFVYKVAEDDEIKRGEGEFFFYPDGSADAAYFTLLRLARYEEDERRVFIKISPATGMIRSMEGYTNDDGSDFYRGVYDNGNYAA